MMGLFRRLSYLSQGGPRGATPLERLRRRYAIPSPTARRVRAPQNSSRGAQKCQNPSRGASETPSTRPWRLPYVRSAQAAAEPSPARNPSKSRLSCLPKSHLGCCSGGRKTKRRKSPGTTGRTGPTAVRRMRLRGRERRIWQLLQLLWASSAARSRSPRFRPPARRSRGKHRRGSSDHPRRASRNPRPRRFRPELQSNWPERATSGHGGDFWRRVAPKSVVHCLDARRGNILPHVVPI